MPLYITYPAFCLPEIEVELLGVLTQFQPPHSSCSDRIRRRASGPILLVLHPRTFVCSVPRSERD
jgi:hypothetical protein